MKNFMALVFALCSVSLIHAQNGYKYNLLIGTYPGSVNSDGIFCYDFDSKTGKVQLKSATPGIESPSYLAISHDGKFVYSVNEVSKGAVSSFNFDAVSGKLSFINKVSSGGSSPCYVSVDDQSKYVFAGNYGSGSLAAFSLKQDGSLGNDPQYIKHEGSGIDKSRQEGPHVHCTVISPDNKYLLTSDLGTDKINIYTIDPSLNSKSLTPASPESVSVKPGSGPRHITFHPNGKFAYLVQEMGGMITVFDYNDGKLSEKQSVTMLSPDFKGKVGAADIHVSADGKFLYASNRGDANEIVIYSIDNKGMLSLTGRQSSMGRAPRNFVIDPSGNFLLVANQDTNDIIIFNRDQKTGLLSPTGTKIQVVKPVCLKFISYR